MLYKGIDLGFDPYKEKDIEQKGKSYLKIKYNENMDLTPIREKANNVIKKKNLENIKRKVQKNFKLFIGIGILGFIFLILLFFFSYDKGMW